MIRVARALGALSLTAVGCGGAGVEPLPSNPPMVPVLNPGMATLKGKVVGADRQPVVAATVRVLDMPAGEAPRVATSGADGSWELSIPGSSAITIQAEAAG